MDPDRERAQAKKLSKQHARELKGAARELRKDNAFVAMAKQRQDDAARDKYTTGQKRVMTFLEQQQVGPT